MSNVVINDNKIFDGIEVNGIKLEIRDIVKIVNYYEAHCSAEVINENFDIAEEDAIRFGREVRYRMNKSDNYSGEYEWDTINELMSENGYERR